MQNQTVNETYLSHLILLSKEQDDEDLVTQLFQNLQSEYLLFMKDCAPLIGESAQRKEFQNRIHKLKNNFYNLGCEEAGSILEEMYQLLKSESPETEQIRTKWADFEQNAQKTFSHLKKTIEAQH